MFVGKFRGGKMMYVYEKSLSFICSMLKFPQHWDMYIPVTTDKNEGVFEMFDCLLPTVTG